TRPLAPAAVVAVVIVAVVVVPVVTPVTVVVSVPVHGLPPQPREGKAHVDPAAALPGHPPRWWPACRAGPYGRTVGKSTGPAQTPERLPPALRTGCGRSGNSSRKSGMMVHMKKLQVVPPAPAHRAAWAQLYAQYADFYRREQTEEMRERVWGWLRDPAHELEGAVALNTRGVPVGFAHYRPFSRPLAASTGCFLDDLFVAPAARGTGAA